MNLKKPTHLTITPTYIAVLEKHTAEEVDDVLRKSFPDAVPFIEDTEDKRNLLLAKINSFKPQLPTIGIDEALRQARDEDFLQ